MIVLLRKYNNTTCETDKIHSFIQAWEWIFKYSKTQSKFLTENTQIFIAKTDI